MWASKNKKKCLGAWVQPKNIVFILTNFTFIVKGQTLYERCWVTSPQCHQNCYTQQGPLLTNPLFSDTAHGGNDWNTALLKERTHRSCNSPLTSKLGFPRCIMKSILHLLLIYFEETCGVTSLSLDNAIATSVVHQIGLRTCLWSIFMGGNWSRRAQPSVSDAIPR